MRGEKEEGGKGGGETVLNKIFKNGFIFLKCTDCRDFFENCTDCTDFFENCTDLFKKNVRIVRIFFSKIVRIVRISPENVRIFS